MGLFDNLRLIQVFFWMANLLVNRNLTRVLLQTVRSVLVHNCAGWRLNFALGAWASSLPLTWVDYSSFYHVLWCTHFLPVMLQLLLLPNQIAVRVALECIMGAFVLQTFCLQLATIKGEVLALVLACRLLHDGRDVSTHNRVNHLFLKI